jgi:hypothetical protein
MTRRIVQTADAPAKAERTHGSHVSTLTHPLMAYQRRFGNAAVSRMLRTRVLQRQIDETVRSIHLRAQQYGAHPPFDPNLLAHIVRTFDAFMRAQMVAYRFGGSMAAWLQGGARVPQDIDVEVANPARMQALAQALHQHGWVGQGRTGPSGQVILLNAHHPTAPNFVFDMVSEADPALTGPAMVHEGMEISSGDIGPTGGVVGTPELIINYLDRIVQKPDIAQQKGDVQQIGTLLNAAGVGRADLARDYWDTEIGPRIRRQGVKRNRIRAIAAVYGNIVARLPAPEPMVVD